MDLFKPLVLISQNLFFALIGIIGIGFLIGFHELGHFLFCKLFKIKTPSFSIGFGPTLWTRKIGETTFKLSTIPFGGYVEIAGTAEIGQGEQKEAFAKDKHSFAAKPFYQKLFVMLGGILFNLIFSYLTFIILFMTGIPKTNLMYQTNAIPVIANIQKESAAEQHGLFIGDKIIAINNIEMENDIHKVLTTLEPLANQKAHLLIERNGTQKKIDIIIGSRDMAGKQRGVLGVAFDVAPTPAYPFWEAIRRGVSTTNTWIKNTFKGFAHMLRKKDVSGMAGPVMIIAMTIKGAAAGLKIFLIFLAIISINLAILNIIPLPILDGGQLLFYGIEALIRKPLPHRVREYVHIITWLAFIGFFLYLSAQDIARIANPQIESILKFIGLRR